MAALIAAMWMSHAGLAQADEPVEPELVWRLDFTPYLFLPSITGRAGVAGVVPDIDASIIDLFKGTDVLLAAMGNFRASYGRFGVFADTQYTYISDGSHVGPVDVDVTSHMVVGDTGISYQLGSWSVGSGQTVAVDGTAGMRVMYLDIGVGLQGTVDVPGGPRVSRDISGNEYWFDPTVGARVAWSIDDHWTIAARGDIGGFGVGSDLTSKGLIAAGETFDLWGAHPTFWFGYMALYEDYQSGSGLRKFTWETTFHGPGLGLGFPL